ncbi:MAG TPA: hypothetical protein VF531_13550 [Bacillota bacterium]
MRKKLIFIGLFLFMLTFAASNLMAIVVEPLTLNYNIKPGATARFKITIKPEDKSSNLKVSLFRVTQRPDGGTDFLPADPETYPPSGWVSFPPTAKVNPGANTELSGTIKVPFGSKGTHNMMLMIESDQDKKTVQGLTIMLRYGVAINVRVDGPPIRATAELTRFGMAKTKKGLPLVMAEIKNTSAVDYPTSATATIRNSQKQLIERIELRPQSYWESGGSEPVMYPESQLTYLGPINQYLAPGEYEVRLFYRYGDRGQILQAKTIKIREGDYSFPATKMQSLAVSPGELSFEGKPNAVSIKAFKLQNRTGEKVQVAIEPAEIEANYAYSIFANTQVELKGDTRFTLEPKQMAVKIVSVRFPKDAPPQGNYGAYLVKVYSVAAKPVLIATEQIRLAAEVNGAKKPGLTVTSISGDRNDTSCLIAAVIKNTGNIQVTPGVNLVLRDKEQKMVGRIALVSENEGEASILPNKKATVTGVLRNIPPGKYHAEVQLTSGSDDLGTADLELEIK